jgi:hypothetical protein
MLMQILRLPLLTVACQTSPGSRGEVPELSDGRRQLWALVPDIAATVFERSPAVVIKTRKASMITIDA